MTGEIERVLQRLASADVRFVVVGGVAVVLHGYLRATGDLDLVIDLDDQNVARAIQVFRDLDFHPRAPVPLTAFADRERRQSWASEKGMKVFSMWSPQVADLEVDVFLEPPMNFDELYARTAVVELASCTVHVVALEDLIAMKRQAGRPIDLADVAALEELKNRE